MQHGGYSLWCVLATAAAMFLPHAAALAAGEAPYQGFGAETAGGAGQEIVHVTTLDDAGPGSLREALSAGNRTIVFDVAGEIKLTRRLEIMGSAITLDGTSAPAPGITLKGQGLVIRGTNGAHDVIVRGIRIREARQDGIQIGHDAHHVVVERVSVHGSGDGSIDITHGAHDVTVCWSLLACPVSNKNMLIKYGARRVTLHHNLFIGSMNRNPQISNGAEMGYTPADETIADLRNNLICSWSGGDGTYVRDGARANLVSNYYAAMGGDKKDAVVVETDTQARAYVSGNVAADRLPFEINSLGTETSAFEAPVVDTGAALEAAHAVVGRCGVRPLDEAEQSILSAIRLPGP